MKLPLSTQFISLSFRCGRLSAILPIYFFHFFVCCCCFRLLFSAQSLCLFVSTITSEWMNRSSLKCSRFSNYFGWRTAIYRDNERSICYWYNTAAANMPIVVIAMLRRRWADGSGGTPCSSMLWTAYIYIYRIAYSSNYVNVNWTSKTKKSEEN